MKRYWVEHIVDDEFDMEEAPDGGWVDYDDVNALLLEAYEAGAVAYNREVVGYIADVREHAAKWVEEHGGE